MQMLHRNARRSHYLNQALGSWYYTYFQAASHLFNRNVKHACKIAELTPCGLVDFEKTTAHVLVLPKIKWIKNMIKFSFLRNLNNVYIQQI